MMQSIGLEIIDQLINVIWVVIWFVSTNKGGKTGETDQLLSKKGGLVFPDVSYSKGLLSIKGTSAPM